MKLGNYYKENPKKVKETLLAFKVFIGTISAGAMFAECPYVATAFLVMGAAIDFIADVYFKKEES